MANQRWISVNSCFKNIVIIEGVLAFKVCIIIHGKGSWSSIILNFRSIKMLVFLKDGSVFVLYMHLLLQNPINLELLYLWILHLPASRKQCCLGHKKRFWGHGWRKIKAFEKWIMKSFLNNWLCCWIPQVRMFVRN